MPTVPPIIPFRRIARRNNSACPNAVLFLCMDASLHPKVVVGLAPPAGTNGRPAPATHLSGLGRRLRWGRAARHGEPRLALFLAAAESLAQFLIEETYPAHIGSPIPLLFLLFQKRPGSIPPLDGTSPRSGTRPSSEFSMGSPASTGERKVSEIRSCQVR